MSDKSTPHPIDLHVGARLRFRRRQLRISQTSLGEALEITFQQIQKYERGANRMSASMLFLAGQRLGVTVEYFFYGLPSEVAVAAPGGDMLAAIEAVPAVRSIGSLDRKTQDALQQLISHLKKSA